MIIEVPNEDRIALFGCRRDVDADSLLHALVEYEPDGGVFADPRSMDAGLYQHASYGVGLVKSSMVNYDDKYLMGTRFCCGSFSSESFLGTIQTDKYVYNTETKVNFINQNDKLIIIGIDTAGKMVFDSRSITGPEGNVEYIKNHSLGQYLDEILGLINGSAITSCIDADDIVF